MNNMLQDKWILDDGIDILEGRYKVIKRLGKGAFAEIYQVEKKKNGEMFAAKIEP